MKYVLMSGSYKKMEMFKEIIDFINKYILQKNISFIAADFYDFDNTSRYVNKLIKLFNDQNMFFSNCYVIDCRIENEEMIKNVENSDIVFLLGGDTLKQIAAINEFNLKKYIKQPNKLVIGMSAGAINMAKKVVLAKDSEDNIPKLSIYEGIGITNLNLEPHCDFKNKKHWKELEEASTYTNLIVMNDDCYIIGDEDKINYYGSYVVLKNSLIFYNDRECSLDYFLKDINYD